MLIGGDSSSASMPSSSGCLLGLRAVEIGLGVGRRVSRGEHQRIAFTQRHIELLGKREQQPAARTGPSGFDEAEVASGDAGVQSEIQLAAPAPLAPLAQQLAAVLVLDRLHRSDVRPP